MARIRSIKPDFWKSETIAALSMQTRLTFIGLWGYVDDNGVGRDQEQLITAEIYPLEDDPRATLAHVHRSLDELADAGRIVRYTNAGRSYLCIVNWDEHQKIDRPNKPRYPKPDYEGSTLTSDDADFDPDPDEPSRESRETPSSGVCSFGAVEQGSRGDTNTPSPAAAGAPLALVTPDGATVIPGPGDSFNEFWKHYPKKVGKEDARKAWVRAHKRAAHKTILDGCIRLARDPNLPVKKYIPHPATWLNRDGWEDEEYAPPPATGREAERQRRDRHWDETAARIDGNHQPRQIGGTA